MSYYSNYHYNSQNKGILDKIGELQNKNLNQNNKKASKGFFREYNNSIEGIAGNSKASIISDRKKESVYGSSNNSYLPSSKYTSSNKNPYEKNYLYNDGYEYSHVGTKKKLANSVLPMSNDIYDKYYDKKDQYLNNNNAYNKQIGERKKLTDSVLQVSNDIYDNYYDIKKKNLYDNTDNNKRNELNLILSSKVGLTNLGNTCFMNTCLQNLIHSEDFIRRLLGKEKYIDKYTPISLKFLNLCKEMARYSSGSQSVTPSEFKQKFGSKHSLFRGYGQNDTQEFCRILLEDMNRELNEVKHKAPYKELTTVNKEKIVCDREFDELFRSRESSIILDSFYGQIINIFTCRCKFKTYSFQKVLDLPLLLQSINSSVSIEQLLDSYFQGEDIQFETKCENCRKKAVHRKEIRFSRPPNILILSLQRINPRTQRKNTCSVSFKESLDISRYIDPECGHSNESRYLLYGIGNHSGSINFGHYYAYIKLNNNSWYEFNDSYVSPMGRLSTSSTTVYTLFYKKNI